MSNVIDQRVVKMQFDNKQFESNVATTMSTLDKLKKSLKLDGASKGLDAVSDSARKCDMSALGNAVQTVHAKFSALEIMGITALTNITNSAINAGKRIMSAFTIDPIKTGFQEYETQINSVQTILANTSSKGTTLKQVNDALDELNRYADKTIYNFTEMTRNIGTFTAAGVDLKTSVSAIQGIANLAAVSGSTSQQASTAMYQLSQALASGTVKLMDWNSVVNAGMGGEVFQNALKETARLHGIAIDKMIKDEGSFRETLQKGWLSSEILTETLKKFTVSGVNEYLAEYTGLSIDSIDQMREQAIASGDTTAAYKEMAKTLAKSCKLSEDQIYGLLNMSTTAEDAATKVKTITQLWDTLKEAAQSGWTQTWEIIVGDFEEAKALLTEVSDVISNMINSSADARNKLFQGWKDLGGRTELIDAIRNAFEGVLSIITPVKEAFREIFPPITAEQLYNITKGIKELTSYLKLSDENSANLKSTFKGLFAVLDIVKQAFSAVFNAIRPLFGGFGKLSTGILKVTGSWGEWLVKLDETIKSTDIFNKAAEKIVGFVEKIVSSIKNFINAAKEKIDFSGMENFHSFMGKVKERMEQVWDVIVKMKNGFVSAIKSISETLSNSNFLEVLKSIWNGIKKIGSGIISSISGLVSGIAEGLGATNFNGILDIINSGVLVGIGLGIKKFIKNLTDITSEGKDFLGGLKDIKDAIIDTFGAIQSKLKADTLKSIAVAIAILTGSLFVLSLIDSEKLSASLGSISVLFADLIGSMILLDKASGTTKGIIKVSKTMISMSIAVLILASALKKISNIEPEKMFSGILGIMALMGSLIGATKLMASGSGTMKKGATQMVIFAVAIKILASVCEDLSKLNWEELAKGLVGVGVLLAEVSIFLNTAKFSGKSITTATGIVILSAALKILASVCKDFASMQWEEIGKGLASIGGLLMEIALFTNLTGNAKRVISTGVALIAISGAIKIFASAMKDMAGMSWENLAKGLVGIGVSLTAVAVATKLMPKNMIRIGLGLIAVSGALVIIADTLGKLGGMGWEGIAKGLTALGGSMTILAIGLNFMNGTIPGSLAMIIAAGALAIMAPVLKTMGKLSWEEIGKGLLTLAGAFTVIGVAGLLLTPLVPTILALGGAFTLIGLGVVGIGAGLLAAGAGLSAISVGITALSAALSVGGTAIAAGLAAIITGVASTIPVIIQKIGEGIVAFCGVISKSAPAIGEATKAIVLTLVDVLVECVPQIADGALKLISGVLDALVEYTPSIVDSLFKFIIGILDGITKNLPALIQAGVDVLMAFFSGVVDALSGIDTDVLIKGIAGVGLLSGIMIALSAVASFIPGAMIGVLGMGVVIAELALVLAAIGGLAQIPGLNWLINEGGKLLEGIGTAIGKFVGGIVGGFMSGVSGQFPEIANDLSAFMENIQPFIEGAKQFDSSTMDGVKALAETILLLTAANILEGLTSWFTGGSSMTKFGKELAEFGPYFKTYYESIKGIDGTVVEASANAAKSLAEFAKEIPNSGGVVGWFAGENSLSGFAEELMVFGPKLKAYADSVQGLDANVVVNSANAAKALAEMASNLPNSGGVVGWFAGENDLSTFASELAEFGPVLKQYADSVVGLDPNVVINSANAAKALAEMAVNLPNQGGVVSWITGDNTLSTFGEELSKFAPSLKSYADSISGIDGNVVINSANAAKALSELAKNLPNSGGLVSWFAGDNDFERFGKQLSSFGQSFSAYYDSIKNVGTNKISEVTKEFKELVNLAKEVKNVDTSGMSGFAQSLRNLGNSGVEAFINTFKNANQKIASVAKNMIEAFIKSAKSKQNDLNTTFNSILDTVVTNINNKWTQFSNAGKTLIEKFIDGIKSKSTAAKSEFLLIISGCITTIKDKYSSFYSSGTYLVAGFASGISSSSYLAENAARKVASRAVSAMQSELDINSPSKVTYGIGKYSGIGFVNALLDYASKAYDAGRNMAESARKGLTNVISRIADTINNGIDTQPTIRPVIDLSDVESGASRLNALLSRSRAMSISASMNRGVNEEIQNGKSTSSAGIVYQFTQNNYSPKPLSRLEIYRQTKNQFSALKGLV